MSKDWSLSLVCCEIIAQIVHLDGLFTLEATSINSVHIELDAMHGTYNKNIKQLIWKMVLHVLKGSRQWSSWGIENKKKFKFVWSRDVGVDVKLPIITSTYYHHKSQMWLNVWQWKD